MLKRLGLAIGFVFSSAAFMGCDPCSQACCLLCLSSLAPGNGGGGTTVIAPGATALTPQLKAVTAHAAEGAERAAPQRY